MTNDPKQTAIPIPGTPRTADQILEDNAKKKGGRPPGRKNNATLAKEAALAAGGTQSPATPPAPAPAPAAPAPAPVSSTLKDDIARMKVEANPAPPPQPGQPAAQPGQPGQPQPAAQPGQPAQLPPPPGFVFTGHLGLIVVDAFISSGLRFALNKWAGYDLNKEDLQLTEKEIIQLEPIANEVAKMIIANPALLLVLGLTGCYMGKIPTKPSPKAEASQVKRLERIVKELKEELERRDKQATQQPVAR